MTYPDHQSEFEALLEYLKRSRGFDFTGYKRPSLMRRVNKRMQPLAIATYRDYMNYLEMHPDEFLDLFNTLLINVTTFFRDRSAWDYLISQIVPRILARKAETETIRIWSAGCASGEESYTLAMAFTEVMGIEQFRERVKIYATEIDDEALSYARQATYLAREVSGLSPEMLATYFEPSEDRYSFRKDLRRSIIFGRHDLIQDAPISKIDLLVCRNTLMYFNAETQAKILARFHFALRDCGFLFLGKAEMLLSHSQLFAPDDMKRRLFVKRPRMGHPMQLLAGQARQDSALSHSSYTRLREVAFDSSPVARLVLDSNNLLVSANERARTLFLLTLRDVGRPLQDLEISYRPLELRSGIEQVYTKRRPLTVRDVEWQVQPGEALYFDIQISPLLDSTSDILGISLTFTDVTRYKQLRDELEQSNQELELAYEELQSANEELETTNEELQSTNEELETTNEELQSTNEELETMNEELQSTNEELQTVNDELRCRSEELNQSNSFLEAILTSLNGGVVVVNRDLQVQIWNHKSEDLWGLRNFEAVGQNFLNLDIGLPVDQLRLAIRSCLTSNSNEISPGILPVVLPAVNRRGRSIQCRITCMPLNNSQQETLGVILLMEELDHSDLTHAPDSSH